MNVALNIILIVLGLILLFALVYVTLIIIVLLRPIRPNLSEAYLKEIDCGGIVEDWCLTHEYKSLFFQINDKHYIIGNIFFAKNKSNKFVICLHGYGYNRNGMLKYVDMLNDIDYNVVIYDHRGLGYSSGKFVTMGYREKEDLNLLIQYLKKKYPVSKLGLLGVSMGAATALLYQEKYQGVDFIIEDCGFADLKQLMVERIVTDYKGLPTTPFLEIAELIIRFIANYTYKDVSPIYMIDKLESTPILFIHGSCDEFIYVSHCMNLYKNKKGIKELLIIDGAIHAGAVITDKLNYQRKVQKFIMKYEN